ncbi:MAG: ASKHA domain-containing protein [Coriobacteriales bacterium]|jgi:uncharacterized 2Fe-2S/4Fe-4S cluster protein (DUF4445 family)|nr:ASKHA domain-containing protein [Coriobacteriales bacterium]
MIHTIRFIPQGLVATAETGTVLLRVAQSVGLHIDAYCGGKAICAKCRVRIVEGVVPEATTKEHSLLSAAERIAGWRFACTLRVTGDLVVELPVVGRAVILEQTAQRQLRFSPAVRLVKVHVEKPTLDDARDDLTRLRSALAGVDASADTRRSISADTALNSAFATAEVDLGVLQQLPDVLRESKGEVAAVLLQLRGVGGENHEPTPKLRIIRVVPAAKAQLYGVAFDIGTTTIAAYLCDLSDGRLCRCDSIMNPQIRYGDDVLSRLAHCAEDGVGAAELRRVLLEGLNALIALLTEIEGIAPEDIVETVIACNTVMHHIICGIQPRWIGTAPYVPALLDSLDLDAATFGLATLSSGNVHMLPLIGGFIGADTVAALVSEYPFPKDKRVLLIDAGTNSELCLLSEGTLAATSCATGPALEGAQIKYGIRAADGAIERVGIDPASLEPTLGIIGDLKVPTGICGSGILDAVAQMALCGVIEPNGSFSKNTASWRVRRGADGGWEYVLYEEDECVVSVTQKDVRAVQLAKAALYAGARELLSHAGIERVDQIILAGAFGSYLDKSNALALGLFPDCKLDEVYMVGNAAGLGARMTLLDVSKRALAVELAHSAHYVETALGEGFQKRFAAAMAIPHARDSFTANQAQIWPCSPSDVHASIPGLILRPAHAEAAAYASEELLFQNDRPTGAYPLTSLDEVDTSRIIAEAPLAQRVLAEIEKRAKTNARAILEVTGPFSLLATLIDPTVLYRTRDRQRLAAVALELAAALADYTISALEKGVRVISFADAEGAAELVGRPFFEAVTAPALLAYLRAVEPQLEEGIMHLCGKTSYSLLAQGMALSKPHRVSPGQAYHDLLFEYAGHRGFRFVGNNCVHCGLMSVPLLYRIELRG